ncbi:DUF4190 domain-containing protein [Saprospiraceae bacterium]|nr:DUF4190 domain-containing protein [Saprospiraceae bacterium]
MNKFTLLDACLIFSIVFLSFESTAVTANGARPYAEINSPITLDEQNLSNLKKENFQGKTGRKLTFKEKIALKILKKKLKKNSKHKGNRVLNEPKTDGMAIASFICSLASVIPFIGILGPFLGIIFGIIALGRINKAPQFIKGKGFAIAGIVIGGVTILLGIIVLVWWLSILTI